MSIVAKVAPDESDKRESEQAKHPHAPAGQPTGGQFTKNPGSGTKKAPAKAPAKKAPAKPAAKKPAPAAPSKQTGTLKRGGANDAGQVKQLQALLRELGISGLAIDGAFGPDTEAAVKAAQQKLGLKPTGRASATLTRRLHDAHALSPCVPKSGSKVSAAHPGARYRHGWIPITPDAESDDLYEDVHDEVTVGDFQALLLKNGDMQLAYKGNGGHEVMTDMTPEDANNVADRIDDALGIDIDEDDENDPGTGMVSWDEVTQLDMLVGVDAAGDIGIRYEDRGSSYDMSREEAEAIRDALRDLAGRTDELDDGEVIAAAGKDVTPGHDNLHHWWTKGEGLALWADSPTPWTTLVALLSKIPEVGPAKAKVFASKWHKEVFGIWVGEKKGKNPLGPG